MPTLIKILRQIASKHIENNMDEFIPFLFNQETGESVTSCMLNTINVLMILLMYQ